MFSFCAFTGRLTADPKLVVKSNGVQYIRFLVAVDRDFKKEDNTRQSDFLSCIVWNKRAEFMSKNFMRGSMITVQGRLEGGTRVLPDGSKRYDMVVKVSDLWFGETRASRLEREERLTAPATDYPQQEEYPPVSDSTPFDFPDSLE